MQTPLCLKSTPLPATAPTTMQAFGLALTIINNSATMTFKILDTMESYSLPSAQEEDNRLPSEHRSGKSSRFVSCREFYA